MAFSCGARSASELKVKGYLRSTLSRRQLQGFVIWRRWMNALYLAMNSRGKRRRNRGEDRSANKRSDDVHQTNLPAKKDK